MSKCTETYHSQYDVGKTEHNWGPWQEGEEGGFVLYTRGKRVGHLEPFTREWQERTCKDCGFKEQSNGTRNMPGLAPIWIGNP